MTDNERLVASIDQIKTFHFSQFTRWHLAAVKSVQKILLGLDDFYSDIAPDLEYDGEESDIVHCQIRNGWLYDAVAHAEQAIEDLFSVMMSFKELATFTKDVLYYRAGDVVKYIRNFDADDVKYLADQIGFCYYPIDENDSEYVMWGNSDTFEQYKKSIQLTQRYVKEMQNFHQKYYDDYCQYKHGLSVALAPMQNPLKKGDTDGLNKTMENPLEGGLFTFHNGTVEEYQRRTGELPAVMLQLKPGMQPHISALHNEGNLLFSTMHHVDVGEVVAVTEHACILLTIIWENLIRRCNAKENDTKLEVAYPLDTIKRFMVIGYEIE